MDIHKNARLTPKVELHHRESRDRHRRLLPAVLSRARTAARGSNSRKVG